MKAIPNAITVSRIIFSLLLLFVQPLSLGFYILYIICGFSDFLDGFIARKTKTTSGLGARLDSLADMIMFIVLFVILYPVVNPPAEIFIWMIAIGIIRLASLVTALIKYKTFAILHTYGNKLTGLFLFLFPLFLPYLHAKVLMYIICSTASLSAVEEWIIHLTSKQLKLNKQSVFVK